MSIGDVVINLGQVSKLYGAVAALSQIDLAIERNRTVAILGPSGCGKTTILRLIAGFIEPDEGTVTIDGHDMRNVRPYERNVGLVFQDYALFPHYTVEQNVGYGLRWRGINRTEARRRVAEHIDLVRLAGFEQRKPGELSGGQQQRVALARALATRPQLLLLDEPLSALDAKLRLELRVELKEILRRVSITTVVVTHDQEEAMSLADDLVVMQHGRIQQRGTPADLYDSPGTRFVAEFIGRSNMFEARPTATDPKICELVTDEGLRLRVLASPSIDRERVLVCVRPERIVLQDPSEPLAPTRDNHFAGKIVEVVHLGAELHFSISLECGRLLQATERTRSNQAPKVGNPCVVSFDASACTLVPWTAA